MYKVIEQVQGKKLKDVYLSIDNKSICMKFDDFIVSFNFSCSQDDINCLRRCKGRAIKRMGIEKVNLTPLDRNRFILRISTTLASFVVAFESDKDLIDVDIYQLSN